MRCAPPLEYAQILEQVDIQESLKSYNTASKILKEKVGCSFLTVQWFNLLVLTIINYKNTQIYIIKSCGTMGFDTYSPHLNE
jgi:hypothetical protein